MTKQEVIKYLEKTDLDIQNARASLTIVDTAYGAYANSQTVHKINYGPVCCYISYNKLDSFFQFLSKNSLNKVGHKLYMDYLKNPQSLDNKITEHLKLTTQLDEIWKDFRKKRTDQLSDKDFLKLYKKLLKASILWWKYGVIGEDKGEVIDLEIVPNFIARHQISRRESKSIISDLSHPEKMTAFNKERLMFLGLCLEVIKKDKKQNELLNDKIFSKKITEYLKEFFWFKTDFYEVKEISEKIVLEDLRREVLKNDKAEILKEIKNIKNGFKKIHQQKEKLQAKIKLSPEDKKDLYFTQRIIEWVDYRKIGMMKSVYYGLFFYKEIAKKFELSYADFSLYTKEEVIELLESGRKVNQREITKRADGVFLVYKQNEKVEMFYGQDGERMFKIATHHKEENVKGMVASTGKKKIVQGVARIVDNPSKDDFEKGEILVTSMTRVEFLPMMRQAKAVITNEGGVACHASIVCRELGIPCIIGTKVATKMLKNGDLIEMDLESGVVRVL